MLSRTKILSSLQLLILLLLLSYDGFTYLPEDANYAALKGIYYVFIFTCYIFIAVLRYNDHLLHFNHWGWISIPLQLFIWAYLSRLTYDLFINNIYQEIATHPVTVVFLYINASIIPFYAFHLFDFAHIDLKKLNYFLLFIFLSMATISFYYLFSGQAFEFMRSDGRLMGNQSLDTIGFGQLGASIVILALAILRTSNSKPLIKILSLFSIAIGVIIVVGAGSRGAIVALFVCSFMYLYMTGRKRTALVGVSALLLLSYILFPYINDLLLSYDNYSFQRIFDTIFDKSHDSYDLTSGRDILYQQGIEAFKEHPLIGTSFLIEGKYVHNNILEAFMSLGILGGFLFIIISGYALYASIKIAEKDIKYISVALLYIQYFIYGFFSRTLSLLPVFWTMMFICISIYSYENKYTLNS